MTPLWGLHLFLVLGFCLPLRLDAPLAYFAANISIPIIAPFLTMAELEIGSYVLTHRSLPMSLDEVRRSGAALFFRELVVGTFFFSPSIAAVGGALAFVVVSATRKPTALDGGFDRVAARYARGGSRPAYYYVRGKLAGDPIAADVARLGDEGLGEVLDAGCGRGQLGVLLLEMKRASRVLGFDWDEAKVAEATRAAEGLLARFHKGDLRDLGGVTEADTVLLVDVLHYLTDGEQDEVLRRAARAARQRVIVRELDPDRGLRSAVTRFQERVTTGLRYNRGARVNVRPIAAMTRTLEEAGFSCEVRPCWGNTPFSNVLVVATRRAPGARPR